jgi:hypothetical protein
MCESNDSGEYLLVKITVVSSKGIIFTRKVFLMLRDEGATSSVTY